MSTTQLSFFDEPENSATVQGRATQQPRGKLFSDGVTCRRKTEYEPTVLFGDCRDLIPGLGKFDFVFADPPFNIGQEYSGYDDRRDDYVEFTQDWIEKAWKMCDGILALHGGDDLVEHYLTAQRRLQMTRIAWVIWHFRFGQCSRANWINAHCHCLIYAKYEPVTWNPEDVLVASDRASKYGDKRIHETENGGERVPGTVWGIPSDGQYWGRVQGGNTERRKDHPNQLPEVYLERLLRAYTNEGDRVLDPFAGSGTTAVVAAALNRRCVTIDISEASCESVRERIAKGAVRINP